MVLIQQGKIRIIGGAWRGRKIAFPHHIDLRPTPDRVRETVFNWLGQDLSGKTCLDLFAGSGVLGFEAASRGAEQVIMVETDSKVSRALQDSKAQLKAKQVTLVKMDAIKFLASNTQQFDIIFLDPPYRLQLIPKLLSLLLSCLIEGGRVYIESGDSFSHDAHWTVWRSGQASKVYYQLLKLETNG